MNKALRFVVSLAVSGGIAALVLRAAGASAREVLAALGAMGLATWAIYAAAQLVQAWLRAVRYRLLLAGAGAAPLPGRGRMFGVTLARNMFVDMLPARAGELAYWALLNRGEGVKSADCASSLAISILFDFLALAAVLAGAVATPLAGPGGRLAPLWGAGGWRNAGRSTRPSRCPACIQTSDGTRTPTSWLMTGRALAHKPSTMW